MRDGGLGLTDLEAWIFRSIHQKPIWSSQFLKQSLKDIHVDDLDCMAHDAIRAL